MNQLTGECKKVLLLKVTLFRCLPRCHCKRISLYQKYGVCYSTKYKLNGAFLLFSYQGTPRRYWSKSRRSSGFTFSRLLVSGKATMAPPLRSRPPDRMATCSCSMAITFTARNPSVRRGPEKNWSGIIQSFSLWYLQWISNPRCVST